MGKNSEKRTVREVIAELQKYNPEAKVSVIAENQSYDFTFTFGHSDGSTQQNCESVGFYVDELCQSERSR